MSINLQISAISPRTNNSMSFDQKQPRVNGSCDWFKPSKPRFNSCFHPYNSIMASAQHTATIHPMLSPVQLNHGISTAYDNNSSNAFTRTTQSWHQHSIRQQFIQCFHPYNSIMASAQHTTTIHPMLPPVQLNHGISTAYDNKSSNAVKKVSLAHVLYNTWAYLNNFSVSDVQTVSDVQILTVCLFVYMLVLCSFFSFFAPGSSLFTLYSLSVPCLLPKILVKWNS